MRFISIDVEANGPYPPDYSLISIGAVEVGNYTNTFYAEMAPISPYYLPEAIKVGGFTWEQTEGFDNPLNVLPRFRKWLDDMAIEDRICAVTDNPYFDMAFINYYLWHFTNGNPFGHSSLSLTSMYKGFARSNRASFKYMRPKGSHTHNALDDATGNARAFEKLMRKGYQV